MNNKILRRQQSQIFLNIHKKVNNSYNYNKNTENWINDLIGK